MTRLAILADIHGNVPALEAVLEDVARRSVDAAIVAGDLVGRGPQGRAVVERVRALGLPAIRGNHEELLLATRADPADRSNPDGLAWTGTRWMAYELDVAAAEYIAALPDDLVVPDAPGVRIVHGSPRGNRDGIGPWTSDDRLRDHLAAVAEPVIACAHTHRPLVRELEEGLVVNVGSVGLPFDGDARASYALVSRSRGAWRAEIRRVPYDRAGFLDIYRTSGFLDEGGFVARLLEREVVAARSHLVPFVAWCAERGLAPDEAWVAGFLDAFAPERPVAQAPASAPSAT